MTDVQKAIAEMIAVAAQIDYTRLSSRIKDLEARVCGMVDDQRETRAVIRILLGHLRERGAIDGEIERELRLELGGCK